MSSNQFSKKCGITLIVATSTWEVNVITNTYFVLIVFHLTVLNWASIDNKLCIYSTVPVACSFDICHLSWLLGDPVSRSRLLPHTMAGECSNGTKFEDLDLNGFNHCGKVKRDQKVKVEVFMWL